MTAPISPLAALNPADSGEPDDFALMAAIDRGDSNVNVLSNPSPGQIAFSASSIG